jgi:hypothetical protein
MVREEFTERAEAGEVRRDTRDGRGARSGSGIAASREQDLLLERDGFIGKP